MTSTLSTDTNRAERRKLIRKTVKRNTGWRVGTSHTIEINLDKWDVPQHQIKFEADDCPYLKMALVDKYLDSL